MNYNGWVDSANMYVVCGWAVNKDDFNDKVLLDLEVNGKIVATTTAAVYRGDLVDVGVSSDGFAGFSFCPFYWLTEEENRFRVIVSGTDIVLPGGDMRIKSKVSSVYSGKPFSRDPLISILMPVYNTDDKWLEAAIESVLSQVYENWELCIADDASPRDSVRKILKRFSEADRRIKVTCLEKNLGVSGASSAAASLAAGEFISLLDHDDELLENALYEVVRAINTCDPDIIYSDEHMIRMSTGNQTLHFKPDFSPDLLMSHNYITHFLTFRKTLFDEAGGFLSGYDGAQDYDLVLRLTEKTDKIHHIPKVLYSWRIIATSVGENRKTKPQAVIAGKNALESALKRRRIAGRIIKSDWRGFYTLQRDLVGFPLVSIIIPFRDKAGYLETCVNTILEKSTYRDFEIIGINNGSQEQATFDVIARLQSIDSRVVFHEYNRPFNYPELNNFGVSLAKGEHIILMNSDIEIITPEWIETLLEHSQREEVGAVGGKLYYPNGTIQHAGIIVGIGGFAGHSHKYLKHDHDGYLNRLHCIQNVAAITGALLMIKKNVYEETGGLDGDNFSVALNDVDFGLRLLQKGLLNVFTPRCEAYHHESISRGYETTPQRESRFKEEIRRFQTKWKDILEKGDPYYNPNLTLEKEDFTYRSDFA